MGKVALFFGRVLGGGFEQVGPVGRSIIGVQVGDGGELIVEDDVELWADVAGSEVEDEGDGSDMAWGMAKVDACTGSRFPFGSAYCTLVCFFEDENGTAPGVKIFRVYRVDDTGVFFEGITTVCI